jgi:hypothetical protein
MSDTATEAEVRAMRDEVFGPSTEGNWAACCESWMRPASIEWLREQVAIIRRKEGALCAR